MVLGRLASLLGIGSCAQAAGQVSADVELDVGIAHQQRLRVGVDRDELNALQPRLDHPVDRVDTATADTHDLDDCQVVLRCSGHQIAPFLAVQLLTHCALSAAAGRVTDPRSGASSTTGHFCQRPKSA